MSRMERTPHPEHQGEGSAASLPRPLPGSTADRVRVAVVDDSAVVRSILRRALESDPAIEVAASAANGAEAIRRLPERDIDVVVLDIDMPVMDGLEALPHLIRDIPGLQVIVASTLTTRNAKISLRALAAGAADYIPKPESLTGPNAAEEFRHELLRKVRALGAIRRRRNRAPLPPGVVAARPPELEADPAKVLLRAFDRRREALEAVVIGSSTGGPQALFTMLAALPEGFHSPILIAQHMPPAFTEMLAEQIERLSGRTCRQASDGEQVLDGCIYIAPGDYHMTVARAPGGGFRIHLDQGPKENYCRPSVDPLLRSATDAWGPALAAVILTGMGKDGLAGSTALAEAGGAILVQDEASSVVWGMPGAVAREGIANVMLPVRELAGRLGLLERDPVRRPERPA